MPKSDKQVWFAFCCTAIHAQDQHRGLRHEKTEYLVTTKIHLQPLVCDVASRCIKWKNLSTHLLSAINISLPGQDISHWEKCNWSFLPNIFCKAYKQKIHMFCRDQGYGVECSSISLYRNTIQMLIKSTTAARNSLMTLAELMARASNGATNVTYK